MKGLSNLGLKVGKGVISFLVSILIFINFFSGIVGGIWLTLSGGLSLVIYGILLSIVMPFIYTIAFLPQMALAYPLTKFLEKGNRLAVAVLGFIISIYGNFILAIWVVFVFEGLVRSQSYSAFPLLLWGYSTTMAPLSYMSSKEPPDSIGTSLGLFFAQFGYLLLTVLFLANVPDSTRNIALRLLVLLFSLITIPLVLSGMKAQKSQPPAKGSLRGTLF